ncbi:alginate lyase family protein [Hymenobacter sp. BT523]|uniref:alginate lyase family protein n=1 Tax=Hymenobacter sp. BT523 TaxID=2795725 RepID=UPI0018EB9EFD|nr:alginate lyase family protein [Hymenobacter sp. BT523]MBJ6110339.1 alginate lyase family protein [Hymenobacter sp. BT523]
MLRVLVINCWLVLALLGLPQHLALAQAGRGPAFILLDETQLAAYKAAYLKKQPAETKQVQAVLREADLALRRGPYFITGKSQVPPSGDKHDYMSQAPYSWADTTKPGGKPYIDRDGLRNPEAATFTDGANCVGMISDVKKLGVAYYFSGKEEYAAHAAKLLRVFFLDPATRMNPNLNFAQAIPGVTTGRSYGMIETRNLVEIPDALAMMNGSKSIDDPLVSGLRDWFWQFTTWATTSKLGVAEGKVKNNHGTFYDTQMIDYALFTGDEALARQVIETQTKPRLAMQLAPDGAQPLELARTRPWNYVTMNLVGWVRLAQLAQRLHIDLWNYALPDGRGLHAALLWLKPYLLQQKQMEKGDIVPAGNESALLLYEKAAPHYPDLEADKVFALYPNALRLPWTL